MIDDINANALNPKEQPRIIDAITNFPGSPSQLVALKALILKILREDKQLTKQMAEMLDGGKATAKATAEAASIAELPTVVTLDDVPERQISRATGAHGSNAAIMLQEVFAGRLANFGGVLRWWTGIEWQRADEATLMRLTSAALSPDQDKMPNVKGTVQSLALKAPRREANKADRKIYFQNGVLDLESQEIHPHHADNNNTGALSVSYNPQAPLGEWADHMDRVFGGLHDGEDRVALLQEIVGWMLITDDLNVQKCVAFDGATRAGKGVVLDALVSIIGFGKCGFGNFANLANGKTQSLFIHHDVVFDHEGKPPPRQETKEAIGFMNKVASNEPVSIQLLNTQTPWMGTLNSKFVFACNGIPVMVDDSGASSTRFLVLRFDRSFEGREDTGIGARMAGCLEGVAAWGVIGLQRLLANDGRFTMPASSVQATGDMKDGNQPLREFIADYCTIGESERCHTKDLWAAYRIYANDANIKACSKHAFFRSLRSTLLPEPVEEKKGLRIDGAVSKGFKGISVKGGPPATNVVAGEFGSK
jgi:putative DNA primase/helicase